MTTQARDGERISSGGDWLGSIHFSARSRRWFYKRGRELSAARYHDAEQAEDALRDVCRGPV